VCVCFSWANSSSYLWPNLLVSYLLQLQEARSLLPWLLWTKTRWLKGDWGRQRQGRRSPRVRKRPRLGKDSFLSKFEVDFFDVNLSQLVSGPYLTVLCTIAHNKYAVKLNALADSRANGFVFIDTFCTINIAKFLNVKVQRLSRPINVKGYDGKAGSAITHILRLHLIIDGRYQYYIPLLILDLGSYNCILGRKWFVFLGVLIDAKRYCLW
jgi:hypothetical protein